jgi:hypothetical protein
MLLVVQELMPLTKRVPAVVVDIAKVAAAQAMAVQES